MISCQETLTYQHKVSLCLRFGLCQGHILTMLNQYYILNTFEFAEREVQNKDTKQRNAWNNSIWPNESIW